MSKFHSVFVAVSGSIYSCGHGEGGRLGTGHQQSSLEPQQMVLPAGTGIRVAAVGANHTVLVTDCGKVVIRINACSFIPCYLGGISLSVINTIQFQLCYSC